MFYPYYHFLILIPVILIYLINFDMFMIKTYQLDFIFLNRLKRFVATSFIKLVVECINDNFIAKIPSFLLLMSKLKIVYH